MRKLTRQEANKINLNAFAFKYQRFAYLCILGITIFYPIISLIQIIFEVIHEIIKLPNRWFYEWKAYINLAKAWTKLLIK